MIGVRLRVAMVCCALVPACFLGLTYFSDRYLILRAISLNANAMGLPSDPASAESFLDQNPSCCSVDRTSHMAALFYAVVEMNYAIPPSQRRANDEPFYRQYMEVTIFGGRGNYYGEGTLVLEKPSEPQ